MGRIRIGILGEDKTDCTALAVLLRRIASASSKESIGITRYYGEGCSHLRRKAAAHLREAEREGCTGAVLLHDLDRNPANGELNDEGALRRELEAIDVPSGLPRLICIPVEELEAWFWADPAVIREVGRGKGEAHPSPHSIKRPKEALIKLSIGSNRKPRYSTNDNASLAEKLDLELCQKRCPSFRSLVEFTHSLMAARS